MAGFPPPSITSHRRTSSTVMPTGHGTSIKSGASKTSAPVSLARRLLFPHLPLSTPIPPVLATTPEDAPGIEALNAEIYDFLALAMRGFVNPWWTKITARDKDLLVEINRVVTYFLRSLEARLVETDLVGMLVHDLPLLVAQHYTDYRIVEAKIRSGYATSLQGSVDPSTQLFHGLQPHLAVSPDGTVDGTYIRQAVEHIMKVCLPPEDWAAETERSIVSEIAVKVLVGDAIPKLTQPWFAHKILLEVLGPPKSSNSLSAVRAVCFFLLCPERVSVVSYCGYSASKFLQRTLSYHPVPFCTPDHLYSRTCFHRFHPVGPSRRPTSKWGRSTIAKESESLNRSRWAASSHVCRNFDSAREGSHECNAHDRAGLCRIFQSFYRSV
jgi:hypothetical protein